MSKTLKQIIDLVDGLKPNAFSNDQKTQWVNECEGKVQTEVFLLRPEDIVNLTYDECKNHELLAEPPHDDIYVYYLEAMIDFHNGEYDRYQNSMEMFNEKWNAFVKYVIIHYRPADGGCFHEM